MIINCSIIHCGNMTVYGERLAFRFHNRFYWIIFLYSLKYYKIRLLARKLKEL